ncbi:hypothetical protein ACFLZ6_00795 [Nanoarchaeota archaeon]
MSVALADVVIFPASETITSYAGVNATRTVKITNVNSTGSLTLPSSLGFTAGSTSLPVTVIYNTSNPLPLPSAGNSVDVQYKLIIPETANIDTYSGGSINLGNTALGISLEVIGRLYIDDLDVTVDNVIEDEKDEDKGVQDGDKISVEARPGAEVSFDFKIGNAFTDDEDVEIKDIVITVRIDDIDDGDELEEESDDFDIDPDDKSDRIELKFEVPLEVSEDNYPVIITIVGEDDNDIEHELEWELELEVEKESHLIHINDISLSPDTVSCDRTTSLEVALMNLGAHDEDEVILDISSPSLGIDIKEEELELDEDFDDDNTYSGDYEINVDSNLPEGKYGIVVKTYYKEGKLSETDSIDLIVEDCTGQTTTTPSTTTTTTTTQPTTTQPTYTTTTQPSTTNTPTIINPPIITQKESSKEGLFSSPWYIAILVAVNVIGIGVLIFLIVKTLRKNQ